jgi:hypothetical protein
MNDEALAPENQTSPAALNSGPLPWETKKLFPAKPADHPYGYKIAWKLVPCTRQELIKACSQDKILPITLVWTPEFPRLLPPVHVPYLRSSLVIRRKTQLKTGIFLGGFLLLATGVQYLDNHRTLPLVGFFVMLLGVIINIKLLYGIKD